MKNICQNVCQNIEINTEQDEKLSVCGVLAFLKRILPDRNVSTETAPFNGKGERNAAINIKVLQKMADDPNELLKYAAYLLETQNQIDEHISKFERRRGAKLISCGVVIDADGNISSWSISAAKERGAEGRSIIHFPEPAEQTWGEVMKKHLRRITEASPAEYLGNLCVQP